MLRYLFPCLFLAAIAIAGCGGGGHAGITPATATPSPAASAVVPAQPSPQVVTLTGAGYTLAFTLPAITSGSGTVAAALQAAVPSGVPVPALKKRASLGPNTALVYLTVTPSATITFASVPSFSYTLPSGTSVPAGSSTYVAFYDPAQSANGWSAVLGPGAVNGSTITFPGVASGVTLTGGVTYVFALIETTQAVPTASPAPTPTSAALPAYCAAYATPAPNANSSPQPVRIVDNSGTGAQVYLYVVTGAPPSGGTQTQYLAANGTLQNFTTGATAPPIPLACFPGSTGGSGLTFELPPPTNANQSGNLYIAYATPQPNGSPGNPLPFVGTSNGGYNGPSLDYTALLPGGASEYVSTPYDVIEYTLPNGVTDVTQVDKVGLPLEVTQGSTSIGFASGAQYQSLLTAITQDPIYKVLAIPGQLNGSPVLARIIAPQDAVIWGFPQDYFYNNTYAGANNGASQGYIGYLMQQYKATPRIITLNGLSGYSGNYCAGSDGTANMLFYPIGSATTCASTLPAPTYTMPVNNTLEESPASAHGVCYGEVFAMEYGGGGANTPFTDETEFYLWKALVIDVARGVALSSSVHPIDGWNTSPSTLPPFSDFYKDPMSNTYAKLVHTYMIQNKSYALTYDEPGGLAPTFTSNPSQTMQVTIWPIPSYSAAAPSGTPLGSATPCPAI